MRETEALAPAYHVQVIAPAVWASVGKQTTRSRSAAGLVTLPERDMCDTHSVRFLDAPGVIVPLLLTCLRSPMMGPGKRLEAVEMTPV